MGFRYAILALLCEGPAHGYALRAGLDDLLGAFWPINQGQIYATLSRLASQSMIEPARDTGEEPRADGPRRSHAIAPEGCRALEQWLALPGAEAERPNELLARIALLATLQREKGLRTLIATQRRRVSRMLRSAQPDMAPPERAGNAGLVRTAARWHCEAELAWLDLLERELLGDG
jgi:DNA-binding PadR family transcriptional regulator